MQISLSDFFPPSVRNGHKRVIFNFSCSKSLFLRERIVCFESAGISRWVQPHSDTYLEEKEEKNGKQFSINKSDRCGWVVKSAGTSGWFSSRRFTPLFYLFILGRIIHKPLVEKLTKAQSRRIEQFQVGISHPQSRETFLDTIKNFYYDFFNCGGSFASLSWSQEDVLDEVANFLWVWQGCQKKKSPTKFST